MKIISIALLSGLFSIYSTFLIAQPDSLPYMVILGAAQDGGYPHIGCTRNCCHKAWENDTLHEFVVSLALADPAGGKWWLFEATPDIREQIQLFHEKTGWQFPYLPAGIFVTHAHIGHYTGLMLLGREAMNASKIPVYVLPRMKTFLENNGPWSQLVAIGNIDLKLMKPDEEIHFEGRFQVLPFLVPHRDEFSETAGFIIKTSGLSWLFIPDIDKWEKFEQDIVAMVESVDYALLDATFYSADELPGRDISTIPHPMVTETMSLFEKEPIETRNKVVLIHFNHSNPLLNDISKREAIKEFGFRLGSRGCFLR